MSFDHLATRACEISKDRMTAQLRAELGIKPRVRVKAVSNYVAIEEAFAQIARDDREMAERIEQTGMV